MAHTHPCAKCGKVLPCSEPLVANPDGMPTVVCSAYTATIMTPEDWLCEVCHDTNWCVCCGDGPQMAGSPYCAPCAAAEPIEQAVA